jgi:hypothetical protein
VLTPLITLGQLLDAPGGRTIVEQYLMLDVSLDVRPELRELLLNAFIRVTPGLRDEPAHRDRFWSEVAP